ncbi:MAG: mandelate racemase/muconate lactonizing enzyme family protein [Chloroflexi bacterium]|nr:mandelate racemase/muconate lactonizing enzyme family protein [Chloroflexota bacterium]
MKITNVKTFIVDGVFRPRTFVKVDTDAGIVGWGDCTEWQAAYSVAGTVNQLGEIMIGRDPMASEAAWWEMASFMGRQRGGIAYKAMSGIDSALWDIRGKALGAPVWQLLGGKMRDELQLYWSHCGSDCYRYSEQLGVKKLSSLDGIRELSSEVLEQGFTGIKTNILRLDDLPVLPTKKNGVGNSGQITAGQINNAVKVIGTFRESLGPDIGIAIDTALSFRLGGAIKLARALEPFNMMWLETETWDPESLRTVRESTTTTICHGESLMGPEEYRPFLETHAQDIVMPDFAWNGITMGKKICDLAHLYDTAISPHNCHSPMNTLVSANICAVVPNFMILEFINDDAPWRDDIMTHPFEVKNGALQVHDRPGLGSDLIESELEKHPWNGGNNW